MNNNINLGAQIYNFIINNNLILLLLAIDTCRAFIAVWGIVPRDLPFLGRIIYGKRDEDLLKSVLLQLGYNKKETTNIIKRFTNKKKGKIIINDPVGNLLHILSLYTAEFESEISYGSIANDKKTSYSRYYLSTMDAVHNADCLRYLTIIMAKLINKHHKESIDFIIVPKGGNPVLAQSVASQLGFDLVIAKDQNDSARPPQNVGDHDKQLMFEIRYEGIKKVFEKDKKKKRGILLDDNTSGGTQLRSIVEEFNSFLSDGQYNIEPIKDVFVLFKLVKRDDNGKELRIEQSFNDIGCKLHRYFDLEENEKAMLANMKSDDYYANRELLETLINVIREKNHLYYK